MPILSNFPGGSSVDATPTMGSKNPVSSGGVAAALANKSDTTHTHTAEDIGAAALGMAVRRNLIINYNLMKPVNQRDASGDSTGTDAYFIDMWKKSAGVKADLSNTGIALSLTAGTAPASGWGQGIYQWMELDLVPLRGQVMTFSVVAHGISGSPGARVRFSDDDPGEEGTCCGSISLAMTGTGGLFTATGTVPATAVSCKIEIGSSDAGTTWGVEVKMVKLELGNGQTLYKDGTFIDCPDYEEELRKCRRYFYRISGVGLRKFGFISRNTTSVSGTIILPTPMRKLPSLSYTNLFLWGGASHSTIATMASINGVVQDSYEFVDNEFGIAFESSSSDLGGSVPYILHIGRKKGGVDYVGDITLSAEL